MTSSEQSTSSNPPITTGRRDGFTLFQKEERRIKYYRNRLARETQKTHKKIPVSKSKSHLLNVDFDVLLQIVAVQVEDQVVDKIESVGGKNAYDNEISKQFMTDSEKRHLDAMPTSLKGRTCRRR